MSQTEIQSVDPFWGEKTRSEALQSETQKLWPARDLN